MAENTSEIKEIDIYLDSALGSADEAEHLVLGVAQQMGFQESGSPGIHGLTAQEALEPGPGGCADETEQDGANGEHGQGHGHGDGAFMGQVRSSVVRLVSVRMQSVHVKDISLRQGFYEHVAEVKYFRL